VTDDQQWTRIEFAGAVYHIMARGDRPGELSGMIEIGQIFWGPHDSANQGPRRSWSPPRRERPAPINSVLPLEVNRVKAKLPLLKPSRRSVFDISSRLAVIFPTGLKSIADVVVPYWPIMLLPVSPSTVARLFQLQRSGSRRNRTATFCFRTIKSSSHLKWVMRTERWRLGTHMASPRAVRRELR
jgi:hypothetical protein